MGKPKSFLLDGKTYYNGEAVAVRTGLALSTVRTYAARMGLGTSLSHQRIYTEADINFLNTKPDGRATRWQKN